MTDNHNHRCKKLEWLKSFFSFVNKEIKHIFRDPRTMLILFGMPVVMMLLFGFAITTDVKNVRTVIVTSSMDATTARIAEALGQSTYFTIVGTTPASKDAELAIRRQKADMAIVFSPRFADRQHRGNAVEILVDAADPNMGQQWANYAQSIIATTMASIAQGGHAAATWQPVSTKYLYNPQMLSSYNFVPGIMGMLLMLICAMMTSVSIAREKERGTMEVLLVSPVKPINIILAKAVPYMLLSILILTTILLMSRYVLDVPLAGSIFWIIVISLIYILLALALGLLVSNVAPSQMVALLVSAMVLLMPVMMFSGLMFPVESMPEILQWISCVIPARWYISAMRKLMIMGVGVQYVVEEVTILCGMTVGLLAIALLTFKTRLS